MRRRRKKADLRIVIRDEEIKIRKTAVRPGQAHQNKKLYSRRNEKRCSEEIPGHDWPGISLYGGMARSWYGSVVANGDSPSGCPSGRSSRRASPCSALEHFKVEML